MTMIDRSNIDLPIAVIENPSGNTINSNTITNNNTINYSRDGAPIKQRLTNKSLILTYDDNHPTPQLKQFNINTNTFETKWNITYSDPNRYNYWHQITIVDNYLYIEVNDSEKNILKNNSIPYINEPLSYPKYHSICKLRMKNGSKFLPFLVRSNSINDIKYGYYSIKSPLSLRYDYLYASQLSPNETYDYYDNPQALPSWGTLDINSVDMSQYLPDGKYLCPNLLCYVYVVDYKIMHIQPLHYGNHTIYNKKNNTTWYVKVYDNVNNEEGYKSSYNIISSSTVNSDKQFKYTLDVNFDKDGILNKVNAGNINDMMLYEKDGAHKYKSRVLNSNGLIITNDKRITSYWRFFTESRLITSEENTEKKIRLKYVPYLYDSSDRTIMVAFSGVDQYEGIDFNLVFEDASNNEVNAFITWTGMGLDGLADENDIVVISYITVDPIIP